MIKVRLSGFIVVPESDLNLVLSELPNHINLTREEAGSISFYVRQSDSDPCRFDVDEEFQSREAFEHHQLRVKASYWGKVTSNVERHYDITEEET
ncbi:MAG: antibiotic biosynthesis monooxygenase [Leptolyngbyaceae cyanobacterium SU_3_3]|nr:antibiotic biosynthesis monooxygenase [Leptolyngbyaceae cyanobacterium SU_3_3]